MNKNITEMTKKEFYELPMRESWDYNIGYFNSLVILPGYAKDIHDSGYRLIDFVAVRDHKPICRLSGCSDVLHIEGIGGFGKGYKGMKTKTLPCKPWSFDCLPKSGLMNLFCNLHYLSCGPSLSSFEIYATPIKS